MLSIQRIATSCALAIVALFICSVISPIAAAAGPSPDDNHLLGQPAPPFVLPLLGESQEVDSDTLFDAYALTLLAFWTTHCAECSDRMVSCQELYDWGEADGFSVVSINFDDHPSSKIRGVANQTAPRVMHLYDIGGRLSSTYDAGSHNFSAFLVDGSGIVRSVYYDVKPGDFLDLKPELTRLMNEYYEDDYKLPNQADSDQANQSDDKLGADRPAPNLGVENQSRTQSKIELQGNGRLRWMDIDTTGVGAVGANGEPLEPGSSLHHKIDLKLSYRISPQLSAGGLIRISNEGAGVLQSGPQYLGHESGSIFIRHDTRGRLPLLGRFESSLIGGYYKIALTPLTLMRWDTADTPISGGQRSQGCGCSGNAGAAGFIRSESLEQLGEDLFFEGARWDLSLMSGVDVLAFYARPQRANPSDPVDCCQLPITESLYQQDMYGARISGHLNAPGSVDLIELGGTAVLVSEDEDHPRCDTGCMSHNPYNNRLLAADVRLPLPNRFAFTTEVATSSWTPNKARYPDQSTDGFAMQGTLEKEFHLPWTCSLAAIELDDFRCRVEIAYQRVDADFFSPYGALSIEPNRAGFRATVRTDWGPLGVGAFYKQRQEISETIFSKTIQPISINDDKHVTWSTWLDAAIWRGGLLMVGGVFDKQGILGSTSPDEDMGLYDRKNFIVSLEQELAPNCTMSLEGEWITGEWYWTVGHTQPVDSIKREYDTQVIRVVMGVEF